MANLAMLRAPDRLMMHLQRVTHRKEGWVFPVGQQHSHSLDRTRGLRSRPRYRNQLGQILISDRQLNCPPPCCHDLRARSVDQRAKGTRDRTESM